MLGARSGHGVLLLVCGAVWACGKASADGQGSSGHGGADSGGAPVAGMTSASGGKAAGGRASGGTTAAGGRASDGGAAPDGGMACANEAASFAVEFAEVTGRVTKNGAPWIPLPGLQFVPREQRGLTIGRGRAVIDHGDGTYTASLPRGAYDLRLFLPGPVLVADVQPQAVSVSGPTEVDIEFPMVRVSGEVLFAGAAFPAGANDRGKLCLRGIDGDTNQFCSTLAAGTGAAFSLEVRTGRSYEVVWSRSGALSTEAALEDVPYGEQRFGTRSFERDSTLSVDVDTPSVVVSGSVAWDGIPLENLSPRPTGYLQFGPLMVNLLEQGPATFQARLLAGTYAPLVHLTVSGAAGRTLKPCDEPGCALSEDTEWVLDVTPSQPTAVVEGTVDFVDAAGGLLAPPPGDGGGTLQLELWPAPRTAVQEPMAYQGKYTVNLDGAYHFRREGLPFGTYTVSYQRADPVSGPVGTFYFEDALLVDREQVSWRQAATVTPTTIDVTVNGERMRDDGKLEGEPRGELLLADGSREDIVSGPNALRLNLGETGPAHFEVLLLNGRYDASISANTNFGRSYARNLEQDVLPNGQLDLGPVDMNADANGASSGHLAFDLEVHELSFTLENTELVRNSTPMRSTMLAVLSSEVGAHPFWVPNPSAGAEVRLPVYSGCYAVSALPSDFPHYPVLEGAYEGVQVGELCTCDVERPSRE